MNLSGRYTTHAMAYDSAQTAGRKIERSDVKHMPPQPPQPPNASDPRFERGLRTALRGEVYFDRTRRGIYATDASIYQIEPVAVCVPLDDADVRAAVAVAAEHGVSILPRGAGTSLAGQCVGQSLVVDVSKHMNRVLEVNAEQRWVRVQPGVVRDNLNAHLAPLGLHFAPDPATSSRANIGGILGNNSAGTRSIVYGMASDHVHALRCLLADGSELELRELSQADYDAVARRDDRVGEIHRRMRELIDANGDEIERRFPKIMRRCTGYALDEFHRAERWNLAKLLVGSEGTLGLTLEAKLKLEPLPKAACVCVVHFDDLFESIRSVPRIVAHEPSAVELLDERVITMARRNLGIAPLCDFIEGDPASVLIVEFFGDTPAEARERTEKLITELRDDKLGVAYPIRDDSAGMNRVWSVRKAGLGLLLGMKGDRKPLPFIEDVAVPVDNLAEYIERVFAFCKSLDTQVVLYAHASVGLLHVRPVLDLRDPEDVGRMLKISAHAFELVQHYGGSWSGEHGNGLARSAYNERFFGPQIYQALREVKRLFDPRGLMNPGKIVDAPPMDRDLRVATGYESPEIHSFYHFREDRGCLPAAEMCSGIGACRQTLAGTTCPSYRATRDEHAGVRGRANALRLAMTGRFGPQEFGDRGVYETLDLCLSCKACKNECPSGVDVARLKSEFLQHFHDQHGAGRRERWIATSRLAAERIAGWKAPLVNWVQSTAPARWMLEKFLNIDRRRVLPHFARRKLTSWFDARAGRPNAGRQRVALFVDTYINYYEPHVGRNAVELLESCGYEVLLADVGCCQRPRISHGFLRDARRDGLETMRDLDRLARDGVPIVVCEPSCASALVDDLPDLIDDAALGERIKKHVRMIDVFLHEQVEQGGLSPEFTSPFKSVLIHGHCHQKALFGAQAMTTLLGKVADLDVKLIEAGCCGMAGSFGYEKEHYDLSLQIGEDRLLPAIRNRPPGAAIVACGFSCRHQIADALGVQAMHWVEALRHTGAHQRETTS